MTNMASSAMISHGRRKGSIRSNVNNDEIKPGQVAVLSEEEWFRLKKQAVLGGMNEPTRLNDRKKLHETSRRIVKHWDNTIEGQRLKRLQAREIREASEEDERVKLDIEEAEFQATKRRKAIEKAKTMLYYQTDRVKQFHRAAVLSEVLKERDAQLEYKKCKQKALKNQDEIYLKFQEEERNQGILNDMKRAEERAAQRTAVSMFQEMQINEKAKQSLEAKQAAQEEQKILEKSVAEFHAQRMSIEAEKRHEKEALKKALDQVLADKKIRQEQTISKEKAEENERSIFADAKLKMTKLRKDKEAELFQQFQTHQQRMCNLLKSQMQEASTEEDERIAKAVVEQAAKKEREERLKQEKFTSANKAIHHHMLEQIAESERRKKDQQEMDQELLKQRIIQDQKFHSQELEKSRRKTKEAKEQQQYHLSQIAEVSQRKQSIKFEDINYAKKNTQFLKTEEEQFQQYASTLINEAKSRGAPIQPLVSAACVGAGGGHGPKAHGNGAMRPSYQVMDSTGVELPTYNPKPLHKDTQKRMGFTW